MFWYGVVEGRLITLSLAGMSLGGPRVELSQHHHMYFSIVCGFNRFAEVTRRTYILVFY